MLGIFGTLMVLLLFMLVVRMEGKSAGLDFQNPCNLWRYDAVACKDQQVQQCRALNRYSADQCIRLVNER
jgi:hypothetical protein